MKFILPLLISVFITGCTLTNVNQSKSTNKEEKPALIAKNDYKKLKKFHQQFNFYSKKISQFAEEFID